MNRLTLGSLAAACIWFTVAVAARGGPMTVVHQVKRAFSVSAITITHGDTVQFLNDDQFDHQIAIDSPGFKFESPGQPPGSVTLVAFRRPAHSTSFARSIRECA